LSFVSNFGAALKLGVVSCKYIWCCFKIGGLSLAHNFGAALKLGLDLVNRFGAALKLFICKYFLLF
jgi:hypothetical protein